MSNALYPYRVVYLPENSCKRDVENEILPFCQENNIGVIVYSPMQSGLLTGKMTPERVANLPDNDWRKNNSEFQEPRLSRNLKLVEVLQHIGKQYDRSSGEVAIAWTLNNPAVTAAIVGARNPKQVEGIIAAGEFRLNQQELDQIATFVRENP
ncbi:aldo/keto reductase [Nostoc sp. CHAB 5715]|uniref:aldo/keto reductase n=1 Tax=Nostoc sp. CHAB 5715 TaxID=2780400 RepID=UPI001E4027F6|nr:aldo/keto reductase [Nostoc sp. CHAB 5715]MCC5623159.1 aldo/keto reductase [Nostoc sp. CHAB 5715]